MKTFEQFVESREKMDPSACKMTDYQWKRAYDAYKSSRERVRKSSSSSRSRDGSSRQSSGGKAHRASHSEPTGRSMSFGSTAQLRRQIRQNSAYTELRTIVDVLAWAAMAIIIFNALLKMSLMVEVYATVSVLIEGLLGVLVAFVLKQLIQVLIDIPDIALFRRVQEQPSKVDSDSES
ncbi:MAG: hypothetical protein ACON4O_03250 [Lentimonas sp.]